MENDFGDKNQDLFNDSVNRIGLQHNTSLFGLLGNGNQRLSRRQSSKQQHSPLAGFNSLNRQNSRGAAENNQGSMYQNINTNTNMNSMLVDPNLLAQSSNNYRPVLHSLPSLTASPFERKQSLNFNSIAPPTALADVKIDINVKKTNSGKPIPMTNNPIKIQTMVSPLKKVTSSNKPPAFLEPSANQKSNLGRN